MSSGERAADRLLRQRRERMQAARAAGETAAGSIPRRAGDGRARLSFAQERLWFLDRLQPGSAAYNIPVALTLRGRVDAAALAAGLGEVFRRQAALRTRIATEERDGRLVPVQEAAPWRPVRVPRVDLAGLAGGARTVEARRLAVAEARRPFAVEGGPLVRLARLALGGEESVLLVTLHHTVADGWSVGVLVRELAILYAACAAGRRPPLAELPEPAIEYADWAEWQRGWLAGGEGERQAAYWRRRLGGAPPLLELPTDRPRPAVGRHRGGRVLFALDAATAASVDAAARRLGATPFVLLLAAFQAFLGRLAEAREVVVGTPVANRRRVECEGLIGFFVNTLAVRTDLAGEPTFGELVARVRAGWLDDHEHQDLPFEEVVAAVAPPRDMSHAPVFQVLFALQNAPRSAPAEAGLTITRADAHTGAAKFDLSLTLASAPDGGFAASLEYDRDLFDRATVERWSHSLRVLLAAAAADPEARLGDLPLLDAAGHREVVAGFQPPPREYPGPPLLHQLVLAQAAATPELPAVRCAGEELSYRQLAGRAGALAAWLVALGVGPEARVAVAMERSLELVVALLAVLRADAAYVPLDPGYPEERLAHMSADALAGQEAPVLLTQPALAERFAALAPAGTRVIALPAGGEAGEGAAAAEEEPPARALPDSPAYVIYTSGSTGRPKGAANTHRALRNRLLWMREAFRLGPGDRVLQKTPTSFDVSVWELFAPLVGGACLVMARPGGHTDAAYLVRTVGEERVTLLHFVPSMLPAFLAEPGVEALGGLRRVVASGESLSPELVARFHERLPHVALENLYGPTEAAIEVSWWRCEEAAPAVVPIGRPLPNVRLHVVDRRLRPQPVGVPGELLIGGVALARGYHRRPAPTAERWVPDPFAGEVGEGRGGPGGRLYRTGDLARWRADGSVEVRGRLDHQVKLRGVRIELGEIESALARRPEVVAAAAGVHEVAPGDGRLVAWVVPRQPAPPGLFADLRAALRRELPDAMVPTLFVALPELPTTPTGKLDRRALPAPGLDGSPGGEPGREPRTAAEVLLAEVWAEVLGRERVTAGDDFFALGGHSLLATQVVSRVARATGVSLPLRQLFETPVLADLAAALDERRLAEAPGAAAAGPAHDAIPRRAGGGPARLSFAQERLWFLDGLQPGSAAYHLPVALRLSGPLDPAALQAALDELFRRQPALRTRIGIGERGGTLVPVQEAAPPTPVEVPMIDLSGLGDAARVLAAARWLAAAEARRPFTLEGGPLVRLRRLALGARESVLLVVLHHAVADGWSVGLLVHELGTLYAAFAAGRRPPLPELPEPPIDYADWAEWQRAWLAGGEGGRQLAYWRGRLAGAPPLLELPTDRPRPPVSRHRGARVVFRVDAATTAAAEALAHRLGATPFVLLLAAFQAFLGRLAAAREVVVGTPVANRRRVECEGLIGCFANTLAVRTDLAGEPTFAELVARVRGGWLDDLEHQDLPFEEVVAALAPPRDMSHAPVFQVLLALQNAPRPAPAEGGLTIARGEAHSGAAKLDLTLTLAPAPDGGLAASLEVDRDLFDRATAERWSRSFRTLLAAAVVDPETPTGDLPLLDAEARREVVAGFQPPPTEYPAPPLLHQLVAAQAAATPDLPAVRFEGEELSYRQLAGRAAALAGELRALGVGPETRVGVAMERSLELVVALNAVLLADAAYVPLDPGYPEERLAHMLADAVGGQEVAVLLTQPALAGRFAALAPAGTRLVALPPGGAGAGTADPPPAPPARALPESPAYVIYTSGSTGRPKGAVNTHRAIRNRLLWMQEAFRIGPGDRVLQKTPTSFDVSVWELFWPLVTGACLVVARPGGHGDPAYLVRAIGEERVTVLHFVPSILQVFLAEPGVEELVSLRRVVASGEALPPAVVQRFHQLLPHAALDNLYGPTEAAVDVSWWPCREAAPRLVPIGRPIANLRLHVVDRRLRPQPIGVPGELLLGGVGLGRGYHARPGLTADRWVPDPFAGELGDAGGAAPGGRLYRTGDLARWRPDGSVEYLGRLDHQVKLRGLRIELGEIEAALVRRPEVAAAAAGVDPAGARLVAWIVPRQGAPEAAGEAPVELAATLRAALRAELPEAMVPGLFVALPAMPLTPTGKIDRRALPPPTAGGTAGAAPEGRPPRTAAEELLADLWAEVLHRERVSAADDFFALGGHSLLAAQVVTRLSRESGVALPLRQVFDTPVLADLAAALEERLAATGEDGAPAGGVAERLLRDRRERTRAAAIPRRAGGGPARLSFAQERLWFLDRLQPGSAAYVIPLAVGLRGPLDPAALRAALDEVFHRQAALRTRIAAVERDGRLVPVQEAMPPARVPVPLVDLGGLADRQRAREEARRLTAAEARRPFALEGGSLVRVRRLALDERESLLLVTLHHAIADGWSLGVLVREIAALYAALAAGRRPPLAELPEPSIDYADWAEWQRAWLAGGEGERQLAYWRRRLAGAPPLLALPTDRPRPPVARHRGERLAFPVDAATAEAAAALARRLGATPFMLLLAAFQAFLGRLAGAHDVVVGTPVASRRHLETEGLVGFFANTLAMRADLAGEPTFAALVGRVREGALADFEHQDLPFEELVAALAPPRAMSHAPIFQVLFALHSAPRPPAAAGDLELVRGEAHTGTAKFDLSLALVPMPDGRLAASFEFDCDLFDRATVERWAGSFVALLAAAVADPERRLADLPLPAEAAGGQMVAAAGGSPGAPAATLAAGSATLAAGAAPPGAGLEAALATIWAGVLGRERVPATVSFFDLGGHSLQLVEVQRRIRRDLGADLAVVDLFRYPTVAGLAEHLRARAAAEIANPPTTAPAAGSADPRSAAPGDPAAPLAAPPPAPAVGSAASRPAPLGDAGSPLAASAATAATGGPAPPPSALADPSAAPAPAGASSLHPAPAPDHRIAVVGLAGRFPDAPDVEALWDILAAGHEAVRRWSAEELAAAGVAPDLLADPAYVPAGVHLPGADLFDAALWGVSPREAEAIDPQQRVFLETALEALEDAGIDPDRFAGAIGVFAGSGENRHLARLARRPEVVRALGAYQVLLANRSDYLPTRVAYKLGLRGPAVNVQTACSTSLVAVHLACRALVAGDCDAALAGGVSVGEREPRGYLHEPGGIASPDGHTRTFDADARGTVRGHGAGVVVLKRLADAVAAGDTVRAVILGSAINNDGGDKAGFTAPGVEGQAAALAAAHRAAGVAPASIGYVEAHGTGTALGDPIEVAALREAFRRGGGEPGRCWIGSLKSNLGHLDAAAGVAGLIKAVLALERELVPPTLHFRRPNPAIDFGPLQVPAAPVPWPRGERPRRAAVSSFGIGGTNAHAVVEEAPPPAPASPRELPGWEVLAISAATESALETATDRLADWLEARPGLGREELADVAWTLQSGRRHLPWRRVAIARDAAGAAAALRARDARSVWSGHADGGAPAVAFLLPGQGSQHPGMAADLYWAFPAFRRAFDEQAAAHRTATGGDLAALVFAGGPGADERLADTAAAQPALFAVEVALARTLAAAGIVPRALLGHSVGELAAAHLAGVFSLADAAALVAERGRRMAELPAGAMLAVALGEDETVRRLAAAGGEVALAAVNGPESCVVAGPAAAVAALAETLAADGVEARPLHTSHAFHSPAMEPAAAPFAARVAAVERRPPAVPYLGNLRGGWATAEEACDPAAWARQLVAPVRFADSLAALAAAGPFVVVEVGPGRALSTLARRHPALAGATVLATQPHPRDPEPPARALAAAVAKLWLAGARVEWAELWGGGRRRVKLPGYPFERRSFWVEVPREGAGGEARGSGAAPRALAAAAPGVAGPVAVPAPAAATASATAAAPRTAIEAALAAAWADVLGVAGLGIHDNFFDLGGSSLLAVRLGGRLRREAGLEVEPHLLLEHPTIADLAAHLAAAGAAASSALAAAPALPPDPLLVPLRREGSGTPLVLVHPAGGHVFFYRHLVAALPPGRPVWGVRALGLEDGEEPLPTVDAMAERYVAALRSLRPRGPYLVGGSSLGGMVAYAMALRLAAAGEAVPAVVQIDTFGPGQMPEVDSLPPPGPDDAGGYEMARVAAVARAGTRAMAAYRPLLYPGRLVYFRATLRTAGEPAHPERPWLEAAGGGVDFAVLPGGHLSMHRPPHVERLAARLAAALARAETGPAAPPTPAAEHEIEQSCPASIPKLHKRII